MIERTRKVESEAARLADHRQARKLYLYSGIAAGVLTLVLYFL